MTTLAAHPIDAATQAAIDTIRPSQADFRAVCWDDAEANDGIVSVSRVRVTLTAAFPDLDPHWLSGQWSKACAPSGFLDKTDIPEPLTSTRNGHMATVYRRWRGWDA